MSRRVKGTSRQVKGFGSATQPRKVKTIDDMTVAELRVLASRYGVKSGGKKKPKLKQNIKAKMKEVKLSDTAYLVNTETGSITTAIFPEEKFNVSVIDKDVEPHRTAKVERLGEGMYNIEQETVLGEQENVLVTVSDSSPYGKTSPSSIDLILKSQLEDKKSSDIIPKVKKKSVRFLTKRKELKEDWYPSKPYDIPSTLIKDAQTKPRSESGRKKQAEAAKKLKEQIRLRKEYEKQGKIYYYFSRATGSAKDVPTTNLIPIELFDQVPEIKYLVEKPDLLKKAGIKHTKSDYISTEGNQLQNVFDNDLYWIGLIDQKSAQKPTPIPHLAKANQILVDNDDGGHYIAYMNNLLIYNDPLKKNIVFVDSKGVLTKSSADEFMAKRFWAKNFANSAAFRRNKIVPQVIKVILLPQIELREGEKIKAEQKDPLKYRGIDGKIKNFEISDQKLALAKKVFEKEATLYFDCAETVVEIPLEADRDLSKTLTTESNVELVFEPNKRQPKLPLTSDRLVKTMVDEKKLDPISAQITLENLYHSGWINYPRSDNTKAEHEPVRTIRDIIDFKGTVQEREMLEMIDKANKAAEEGINFMQKGKWVVKVDDKPIIDYPAEKTVLVRNSFTADQFDLTVNREGHSDSVIVDYLHENKVGTPATRMTLLAEMKQAGIIKVINKQYVVDARGIVLAATHDYFRSKDISWFNAVDLGKRIDQADTIEEIEEILSEIKPLDQEKMKAGIAHQADPLIEAQKDLAVLEAF